LRRVVARLGLFEQLDAPPVYRFDAPEHRRLKQLLL